MQVEGFPKSRPNSEASRPLQESQIQCRRKLSPANSIPLRTAQGLFLFLPGARTFADFFLGRAFTLGALAATTS